MSFHSRAGTTSTLSGLLESRIARVTAFVLAVMIMTSTLVSMVGVGAAQADSVVTLTATAAKSVLAGASSTVTLTATNNNVTNLYNAAFSFTLPVGASYLPGSTTPSTVGDPQVITVIDNSNPANPVSHQILVWNNVQDLPANDVATLSFGLKADPTVFPVGSAVTGTGGVYAQTDPRLLVKFDPNGAAVSGSYTNSDTASTAPTAVTALKVTKTEPSPESELMRGVHDHPTTYAITVDNTNVAATNGVTVVDYVPAALEFLGCGGVDNGPREYPNAASLASTPAVPNCVVPVSVATVLDPAGQPAGVYTAVTWNLADFGAGATKTIVYAAGIPLRSNTMTFAGGTPTADSLGQEANLDNNTGASTRHDGIGQAYTNTAIATGTYTGPVANGASTAVHAEGSATVTSMDLSVVKSNKTPVFDSGSNATYDLLVRTSEYTDVASVTVTDIIPNGLCPLLPVGTSVIGILPADCTGHAPVSNATVNSETVNSDGSFSVVFTPTVNTAANANFIIEYTALMRTNYQGSVNAPTSSGDSYVNTVSITGQSTPITALGSGPTNTVTDGSQSTITSTPPTIDKQVLPRTDVAGGASDCTTHVGQYVSGSSAVPNFQLGDFVCFQLTVNFSKTSKTKNAQVSDFVPVGTSYHDYVVGAQSTVPVNQVVQSSSAPPAWSIGAAVGSNPTGDKFVDKGAVLVLYVSALVTKPSATTTVDITDNLMKYRQTNTRGAVFALRTQAGFSIAPSAAVSLAKGVTAVNGALVSGAPAASATIKEQDTADFRLVARNIGTAANGNDFSVDNVTIWDLLPAPLTCASVSLAMPSYDTCTDNFAGVQSRIAWTLTGLIAPGAAEPAVSYRVTVPDGISVSTTLVNNSSVVSFTSPNTQTTNTTFYPTNSLDTANSSKWNTTAANANARLVVADAVVAKSGVSSIGPSTDPNNSADQVVAGETVHYSYQVTVPAHSSVNNGVLSDALPAGLGAPATVTATIPTVGTVGPGSTGSFTLSTTGTLTFPSSYDNTSNADQIFIVNLGGVPVSPSETIPAILTNTATFTSNATLGGTPLPPRTATKSMQVIVPTPTLTKSAAGSANAGEVVSYTITADNGASSPIGYDTAVVDCLPPGLTFVAYGTAPSGVTTSPAASGTGSNGCATGTTLLSWKIGALAAGVAVPLTYTARVDPQAAGLTTFTNTAKLTTSTLDNGENNAAVEGVLTAAASATTTVDGATTTKASSKTDAAVGDSSNFTISVSLPAKVNFYNAAVLDQLPAGLAAGTATVSCETVEATPANCGSQLPGTGAALTPSGTLIGFPLGDVAASPVVRTVTVTYVGTITDVVSNRKSVTLTNTAALSWDTTNSSPAPTSAGGSWDKTGTSGSATLIVDEPNLTIRKAVSNATPEPGSVFNYTLSVDNSNAANTSSAYAVTVSDTVPTGVIVNSATIRPTPLSFTGATPNGGGVITWSLTGPLAANSTTTLDYSATLAASSTLITGAGLKNTATIPSYASLPSGGRTYATTPPTATATVTPKFPAVTLAKAATVAGPAYANKPYSWTLTLADAAGAGVAATIAATDVLPVNWTYVAGSATVSVAGAAAQQVEPTATTSGSTQTLVWQAFGPVAAGKSLTIVYSAMPTTAALTNPGVGSRPHINTLTAVTTDATGATGNASNSFTGPNATGTALIASADVRLSKTAGAALVAGTTTANAWSVVVSNLGPDTAVGPFTVADTPTNIPAGVTIVSAAGTGWTCTTPAPDSSFSCSRTVASDTLARGASFPEIDVRVSVAATVASGATVDNSASVTEATFDPDTSNNTSARQLTVTANADLSIVKQLSGTAAAGQTATWTIDVTNLGPSVSAGPITVTDTVPSGLSDVSVTGTGWTCGAVIGGTVTCTRPATLPVGVASRLIFTGLVPSSYSGNTTNTATVTSTTTDPVTSNNSSTATNPIDTATSISLKKTLTGGAIVPGSPSTYRFDVTNTGLADARSITVVDPLPKGLSYSGTSTSITGSWSCAETTTNPSTVTCTLTGTLSAAAGSNTASVSINVNVPSSLTGPVTNTATATSSNAGTVSASASDVPTGTSDLTLTKTHPSGPVLAGTTVGYTLTASNLGPSDTAGPIEISDVLPAGEAFVSATGTGWNCPPPSDQTVVCTRAFGLISGATAPPVTVIATVGATVGPSTITNTATVNGPNFDPAPGNNVAHDPTVVSTSAAVTIAKSGSRVVTAGATTSYSLVVTNAGPSDTANLVVSDTLPLGETAVSISGTGWACTLATLTCSRSDLGVTSSTITVVTLVASDIADGASLTNTASTSWSDSGGTNTSNAVFTSTVQAIANLQLTKSAGTPKANAGDRESFSFGLTNTGASDAVQPITITDTLPSGMSFLSSTGNWTCTLMPGNTQRVDCRLDGTRRLPSGGTAPVLVLTVQLAASLTTGTITNTAVAATPTRESTLADNSASAAVTISQLTDLSITKTLTSAVRIGDRSTFSLAVHNNGPSDAHAVTVVDVIPSSLTNIDVSGVDPTWACVIGSTTASGTPVDCSLTGVLMAGGNAPAIVIGATVVAAAYPSFDNTATVATTTTDSDPSNNSSTITVAVPAQVTLSVVKQHLGVLVVGQNGSYRITVSNAGPTAQPGGYRITDALPAGLSYVSESGNGTSCIASGSIVTCTFANDLANGASASITLTVAVGKAAYPSVTNSATVETTSELLDPAGVTGRDVANVSAATLAVTGTGGFAVALLLLLVLLIGGAALVHIGRRRERTTG